MPRSLAVFIGTLLVFLFSSAHANFYVVAGGGKKVGTEIKALPFEITEPGFYYITKNLSCVSGAHGITIESSDVTIDLMGFSLVGPGGTGTYCGIYADTPGENLEVRNGIIREFQDSGIKVTSVIKGVRTLNIKAFSNGKHGIILYGASGIIKGNICMSNGTNGIQGGYSSTITGNSCYDNGNNGIDSKQGSTITGNTCHSNIRSGIDTSHECAVINNSCRENGNYGIYVGAGSSVIGNSSCSNTGYGIYALHGSSLQNNSCYSNGDDGIRAGVGSSVIGNSCYDNDDHGIYVQGNSYVGQNTSYDNGTNINDCSNCSKGLNHIPSS